MKRRKKNNMLDKYSDMAVGLGKATVGIGVSAALSAGMVAKAPLAAPAMGGFTTLASGASIGTTAMMGHGLLSDVQKLSKKTDIKLKKRY